MCIFFVTLWIFHINSHSTTSLIMYIMVHIECSLLTILFICIPNFLWYIALKIHHEKWPIRTIITIYAWNLKKNHNHNISLTPTIIYEPELFLRQFENHYLPTSCKNILTVCAKPFVGFLTLLHVRPLPPNSPHLFWPAVPLVHASDYPLALRFPLA